ncbi:MAG TPA: HAD family hydrolase [Burkholderiales bacterium]|nr:HAD family hydrolase [Burkholderiales bacterium]
MSRRLQRAVFLDRDGVVTRCEVRNGKPYALRSLNGFRLLPRVKSSIAKLKRAGFIVIIVTNQPDIGNGLVDPKVVSAMHDRLRALLPIDEIRMCPHRQTDNCRCRKPKPGMLRAAARKWGITLKKSFMVGDRWGDIVAGQAVGCYTVFVDRHYKEPQIAVPDGYATSLASATRLILSLS